MKVAERVLYTAAGAHFAAAFARLGVEWRAFYYGSIAIGAVAAMWMFATWFRDRQNVGGGG
ncbi:MAG: hypothetical protein ACJAWY_001932 [Sphingomonas echinoides]|jgi:hypothetical protein